MRANFCFAALVATVFVAALESRGVLPLLLSDGVSVPLLNLALGSSQQLVEVIVDTGSTNLWLYNQDHINGYRANNSTSFRSNTTDFSVRYLGGQYAEGIWGSDILVFGNESIPITFGYASAGNASQAVLGLSVGSPFIDAFYQSNAIARRAYSIQMGDAFAGSFLVLGGVDQGLNLSSVPLVGASVNVMLHGISVGAEPVASFAAPALLDTGTTRTHLPSELLDAIAESQNATWDNGWVVPCLQEQYLELNFSGIRIDANWMDFLVRDGNQCRLALQESDEIIVGLDFLRSCAFIVDFDTSEVALGQSGNSGAGFGEISSYQQAPGYSLTATASVTLYAPLGANKTAATATVAPVATTTSTNTASNGSRHRSPHFIWWILHLNLWVE